MLGLSSRVGVASSRRAAAMAGSSRGSRQAFPGAPAAVAGWASSAAAGSGSGGPDAGGSRVEKSRFQLPPGEHNAHLPPRVAAFAPPPASEVRPGQDARKNRKSLTKPAVTGVPPLSGGRTTSQVNQLALARGHATRRKKLRQRRYDAQIEAVQEQLAQRDAAAAAREQLVGYSEEQKAQGKRRVRAADVARKMATKLSVRHRQKHNHFWFPNLRVAVHGGSKGGVRFPDGSVVDPRKRHVTLKFPNQLGKYDVSRFLEAEYGLDVQKVNTLNYERKYGRGGVRGRASVKRRRFKKGYASVFDEFDPDQLEKEEPNKA
jgi:ribosomal protein L23